MGPVIDVERLHKRYRSTVAVDDVSFHVERGEIFGIIGPNGSGKTTTVECLQGLRAPDSGRLDVLGLDPRTAGPALRHRIGSQLQESALPDRLRVWEALDLFGSLAPGAVDREGLMDEWGLLEKRDTAFADLSGGQRQRLFVALALVTDPELVFFDELTTGLDPAARRVAWELIQSVRDRGKTIVLVTHFMDEAERLCDRLAVFRAGRVVDIDTPSRLITRHGGRTTVRFTAALPELDWLEATPCVESVRRDGREVVVTGSGPVLAHVGAALVAHGFAPDDLRAERATLEDVYLALTREAMSSADAA